MKSLGAMAGAGYATSVVGHGRRQRCGPSGLCENAPRQRTYIFVICILQPGASNRSDLKFRCCRAQHLPQSWGEIVPPALDTCHSDKGPLPLTNAVDRLLHLRPTGNLRFPNLREPSLALRDGDAHVCRFMGHANKRARVRRNYPQKAETYGVEAARRRNCQYQSIR